MGGRVCFWGCCVEPAGLHICGTKNTSSDSHPPGAAQNMPHTQPPPEDSVCWGWGGARWSQDGHPCLGETPETQPAGPPGPSSGDGIKRCFLVASGTRPRAASRGHRHNVSGWRGPFQSHRPAAACLPREAALCQGQPVDSPYPGAELRHRDESQTRTGPRTPASPSLTWGRPAMGHSWLSASRAQGAHGEAPGACCPSRVFGRARAWGIGHAAPSICPGKAVHAALDQTSAAWGYLLLLVTPGVRKPWWAQQAPGGWGCGGAARRARTPWRGPAWGRGPGKRPEVLLYCGQAQGMRGSCTGSCGDA